MSTDRDRHDYSLLGSFMPKEGPDPRKSIPVEVRFGDEEAAPKPATPPAQAEPSTGA